MSKFTTALFMAVALCATFTANAARPSFTSLQQQVNQLQAENNAQQAQIDAITNSLEKIPEPGQAVIVDDNGVMLGDVQTVAGNSDETRIYFKVNEKFYATSLDYRAANEDYAFRNTGLFYDQPGCTGNVYTYGPETNLGIEYVAGGRDGLLYISYGDTPQTFTEKSKWTNEDGFIPPDIYIYGPRCANVEAPEGVVVDWLYSAVQIIDTNIYTKPFHLKLTPPN